MDYRTMNAVLVVNDLNIRGDLVDGPPQVVADGRGASNSATPSRVIRNADWQVRSVTRLRFRSTRPA